jgi:iron complex outermembrane receptor protein
LNQLNPQSTTNVQVGTTWVGPGLTVSADVYTINFSNEIEKTGSGNDAYFYNLGGVKYKGVEAEGTYVVGWGFSVYANASYNSARLTNETTTNDTWVPATPDKTAALALLYKQGPVQGALVEKYIGRRYGDADDYYPLGGYGTMDASLNYVFASWGTLKNAKIGITAQNLADRKSIYYLAGYSGSGSTAFGANGVPLLFTLPGRSAQLNLQASF